MMDTKYIDDDVRNKIKNFLDAQKELFEFILKNQDRCVHVDEDAELNYSYIALCGHRYPDYHRIADVSLYGERYQICACSACNGHITFIKYPYGWASFEEEPGVPVDIPLEEVSTYISDTIDNLEYDVIPSPGMFRDMEQHVKMMGIELEKNTRKLSLSGNFGKRSQT